MSNNAATYPENIYPIELDSYEQKINSTFFKLRLKKHRGELNTNEAVFLNLLALREKLRQVLANEAIDHGYTFAQFLGEYLSACELQQVQFAAHLTISKSYLSKVINDKKPPSADFLAKLEVHANHIIKAKDLMILVIMDDIPKRLANAKNSKNLNLESLINE